MMTTEELNTITGLIVTASIQIHKTFAPGLLESFYTRVLAHDLQELGLTVQRERSATIAYKTLLIENAFRADLVVENCVILEIKSVHRLHVVSTKQLLTYLRLMDMPVGLLINFGEEILKHGIRRVVNTRL